jgi:hypothetical protein
MLLMLKGLQIKLLLIRLQRRRQKLPMMLQRLPMMLLRLRKSRQRLLMKLN